MSKTRPFGAWASPISAASLVAGVVGFGSFVGHVVVELAFMSEVRKAIHVRMRKAVVFNTVLVTGNLMAAKFRT